MSFILPPFAGEIIFRMKTAPSIQGCLFYYLSKVVASTIAISLSNIYTICTDFLAIWRSVGHLLSAKLVTALNVKNLHFSHFLQTRQKHGSTLKQCHSFSHAELLII